MIVAIEGMPLANPRVERRRSSPPLYERYGTPSQVRLGDIRRSASHGSMGIWRKASCAFAPRDPTRRGRESRNLSSPTSTDLERFAAGVSGGPGDATCETRVAPSAGQPSARRRQYWCSAAIRDAGIAEQYRSSQTRRAFAIIRRATSQAADALREQPGSRRSPESKSRSCAARRRSNDARLCLRFVLAEDVARIYRTGPEIGKAPRRARPRFDKWRR